MEFLLFLLIVWSVFLYLKHKWDLGGEPKYKNTLDKIWTWSLWNISVTDNNELVRSSSEKIIADLLKSKGIIYEYETPIKDDNWTIIVLPDFFLVNENCYLEFWGEIDDGYKKDRRKKQAYYKANNIKVINIYPNMLWKKTASWKLYADKDMLWWYILRWIKQEKEFPSFLFVLKSIVKKLKKIIIK